MDQETLLPRSEDMEFFNHNDQKIPADPTQVEEENGNNHDNSELINNNVDTNQLVDQVIPVPIPRKRQLDPKIQEIANQENGKTTNNSQWSDFNAKIVENGLNYTTTITNKSIVFHVNDGFNYLRSGIDSTGTSVFLR